MSSGLQYGVETGGHFGLQHTDTNMYVFSAELLRLIEDHATVLAGAAGLPVAGHSAERVAASFTRPFEAGDRFTVRGRLWRDGSRTLSVLGIHEVTETGVNARAAVSGRVEGEIG